MYIDSTGSSRREAFAELLRNLSRDLDPVSSINTFTRGMRALYGNQAIISISLRNMPPGHYRVMRILHQEGVLSDGYENIEYAGPGAPVQSGGIVGKIVGQTAPLVFRELDVHDDPALGHHLSPYRVMLAVPVFNQGALLNWVLYLSTDPEAFDDDNIENRIIQSNLMGEVTNNKRISHELRRAAEWIQHEIDEIAQLQKAMLPDMLPLIPGLELAALYETYDRAGGDYYDVFPIEMPANAHPRRWAFFIADASGHGPSAAVVIAVVSTLLRTSCLQAANPGDVLSHLNEYLASRQFRYSFVTAFLVFLDADSGAMLYASAGHNSPIVRATDGQTTTLDVANGLPLGILPGTRYSVGKSMLPPGHTLVLYTDGITEAKSPAGSLLGEHTLSRHIEASAGTASDVIQVLLQGLRAHEAGSRPLDDQTVLAIRRT